jgi:ABC-type nitrate/sulfonate/bicarbonate transport system substrate-binding protein
LLSPDSARSLAEMKPYLFSILSLRLALTSSRASSESARRPGFLPRTISLGIGVMTLLGQSTPARAAQVDQVRLDWAYYNPVSLVLKEKGWLEEDLRSSGIAIEWVQSLGGNKALEFLRGKSIDFGSTAGAAAFIGRANGNPIKAIYVYSAPEWTALVTSPTSRISRIEDLKGKRVAVTRGTDPISFFFVRSHPSGLLRRISRLSRCNTQTAKRLWNGNRSTPGQVSILTWLNSKWTKDLSFSFGTRTGIALAS